MSTATLRHQLGRRGPVLCHYQVNARSFGHVMTVAGYGGLLILGCFGHALAIGWTTR